LIWPSVIDYTTDYVSTKNKYGESFYFSCDIELEVDLINIDKPEDKISTISHGFALDPQDKAFGKAYSYAYKTALLKAFMIETGENDESRVNENNYKEEVITEAHGARAVKTVYKGDPLEFQITFGQAYNNAFLKDIPIYDLHDYIGKLEVLVRENKVDGFIKSKMLELIDVVDRIKPLK